MRGGNRTESPLDAAAGAAGPHTVDAFKRLANETRLAILLALWETHEPFVDETAVSFSELFDRVGYDTSANFSYHLEKLEGHFVESTPDGYRLKQAGHKVVRAIIAGIGLREPTFGPEFIDVECPRCGESLAITYENGHLYTTCTGCEGRFEAGDGTPSGVVMGFAFDPPGLSRPTPEEIFSASVFRAMQKFTMQMGGLCPACSGPVQGSIHVCDDHGPDGICPQCGRRDELQARWVCTICKNAGHGPPGANLVVHPRVVAFYADRGLETGYDTSNFATIVRTLRAMATHRQELVARDPLRVRVTIEYDGDQLQLLLDETMAVVDVID